MEYQVTHITEYDSANPISVCHNQAWLTPRNCHGQICQTNEVIITPEPSTFAQLQDGFGNTVTSFSFNEGYKTLEVKSVSRIEVTVRELPDRLSSPAWEQVAARLRTDRSSEWLNAYELCFDSPRIHTSEELRAFALPDFTANRPIVDAIAAFTERIHKEFEHDPKATTVTTPILEVLARRRGVCQDFAQLQIGALRSLGLAARYVSGYVRTHPPKGKPRLVGADASHAWLSIYCGEQGWIDIDPTNNLFPTNEHITVAWGRDYSDVTPLRGVYTGGGRLNMNVSVDVALVDKHLTYAPVRRA